jgi:multimeric flavodoxin WrbA
LLIIGSPTRAFSPSENIKNFINNNSFKDIRFAAFDTRIDIKDAPKGIRFLIKMFGYANTKISKNLLTKGAEEIIPPEGFYVEDKEGPLKSNELKKVNIWLKDL